jgi:3-methyladenine DNA glycosylase AlkD
VITFLEQLRVQLQQYVQSEYTNVARFFKTDADGYSAHDTFLGIKVPILRSLVLEYASQLQFSDVQELLYSKYNEERLFALFVLVAWYEKSKKYEQYSSQQIHDFYIMHIDQVNNWNLVDASAHLIIGAHAYATNDMSYIHTLKKSVVMWHNRIVMVATWYFIKNKKPGVAFEIATHFLTHRHDLMHKATGWMLREAGKKDEQALCNFLDMLRYALENFDAATRKKYMNIGKYTS